MLTGVSEQMVMKYINGTAGEWIEFGRADVLLTAAGQQYRFLIDVPIYKWIGNEFQGEA